MKLYQEENREIIYRTQIRDPFFDYMSGKIFEHVDGNSGRLLDLGCGSGRNVLLAARRGMEAVGVDIEPVTLSIGRELARKDGIKHHVKFIRGDLTRVNDLKLGKFDYVVLQEVLEHLVDYQTVVDFAYRILKPGGKIIITTPNDPRKWNIFDDYARHVRRFRISEIEKSLTKFKIEELTTTGFPFHWAVTVFYNLLLKISNQKHEAKNFRKNKNFHNIYYIFGRTIMKFDNLFRTGWGMTILAVGVK